MFFFVKNINFFNFSVKINIKFILLDKKTSFKWSSHII